MAKRSNKKAVLKFNRKPMNYHDQAEEIVTDRLASYKAAPQELQPIEKQQTAKWLNNRIANSQLHLRPRERAMQRSRRIRSRERLATVHSSVQTHLNHVRSLTSRDHFKETRTAALAEWRRLGAA